MEKNISFGYLREALEDLCRLMFIGGVSYGFI